MNAQFSPLFLKQGSNMLASSKRGTALMMICLHTLSTYLPTPRFSLCHSKGHWSRLSSFSWKRICAAMVRITSIGSMLKPTTTIAIECRLTLPSQHAYRFVHKENQHTDNHWNQTQLITNQNWIKHERDQLDQNVTAQAHRHACTEQTHILTHNYMLRKHAHYLTHTNTHKHTLVSQAPRGAGGAVEAATVAWWLWHSSHCCRDPVCGASACLFLCLVSDDLILIF